MNENIIGTTFCTDCKCLHNVFEVSDDSNYGGLYVHCDKVLYDFYFGKESETYIGLNKKIYAIRSNLYIENEDLTIK